MSDKYIDKAITRIAFAIVMADGQATDEEIKEMTESLVAFDVSPETSIEVINENSDIKELFTAAIEDVMVVAEHGSEELKAHLFAMAVNLMLADGEIDELELEFISVMKTVWELGEDE